MPDDEPTTEAKEPNMYLKTLNGSKQLINDCSMTVHEGFGSPGGDVAGNIQGGGWECAKADAWVKELTEHCKGIMGAFTDASLAVVVAANKEPDEVPEHDPRGLAWNRSWSIRRRNL